MMAFDAYKILDEQEAGSLIDLIAPCMDDYLYIIDLKNDTLRISQSAVERFMLPDKFMNDATKHLRTLVYEKDRKLLENHKRKIYDGKEKRYNVLCRLISGKNSPVWISCRGEVIHDNEGKPHYNINATEWNYLSSLLFIHAGCISISEPLEDGRMSQCLLGTGPNN